MPWHAPYRRGHETYNFVKPFLGHHYFILRLSYLCPEVVKKIKKNNAYHYDLYGLAVAQEPLPPRGS